MIQQRPFLKCTALWMAAVMLLAALATTPVRALTIAEEREMAGEFMETIHRHYRLIHDPMALDLVRLIGARMVKYLDVQPFDFSYNIVDDPQFNAFAGPGGNIFVHRGLITGLDNVDELAGILGHETAHAACRHVSQMMDRSKVVNIGTIAGVLAGVLAGAAGGGEAGQAVMVGAMAAGQTAMLAYSRENETEADQLGLKITSNAGFSPRGLLTGLEKIRSQDWYGMEKVPGYLKTHPGSGQRIINISAWLEKKGDVDLPDNGIDPFRFDLVKYRLAARYGEISEVREQLDHLLETDPDNPALHYGMALLLVRSGRLDRATLHLRQALKQRVFDPYLLVEMGRIHVLAGDGERALAVMDGLEALPETAVQARYYQARARLLTGDVDRAEKGFSQTLESNPAAYPRAWYYRAQIADRKGQKGIFHLFMGRYHQENGALQTAVAHLEASLRLLKKGDPHFKPAQDLYARLQKELKRRKRESAGA